jgi:heme oxygenase
LRELVLSVRPGIATRHRRVRDEARQLKDAADTERIYIDEILPRKLQRQAEYVRRATLVSDVMVLGRTLRVLFAR